MATSLKAGLLTLLLMFCGSAVLAQKARQAVEYAPELSRTAVWVGDAFDYRVTLTYDKNVEIILDNLKKENLNLEPFTLLELRTSAQDLAGERKQLEIALVLTTESVAPEARIPSFNIYYATRRRGPLGKGTEVETHTLTIPEKTVGLRSTLTSESRDIRDEPKISRARLAGRVLLIPGWILLGIMIAQVGVWSLAVFRQKGRTRKKRNVKSVEQEALRVLGSVASGPGDGCERYQRVSQVLRNAVRDLLEVEASGLTPQELKEELLRQNVNESLAGKMTKVLEECDTACYAPRTSQDGDKNLQSVVGDSRDVISRLVRL